MAKEKCFKLSDCGIHEHLINNLGCEKSIRLVSL